MSEVVLYGFPLSSYVNVTRFVLARKEVQFEFCDLESEMGEASGTPPLRPWISAR